MPKIFGTESLRSRRYPLLGQKFYDRNADAPSDPFAVANLRVQVAIRLLIYCWSRCGKLIALLFTLASWLERRQFLYEAEKRRERCL